MVWAAQVLCGIWFGGNIIYFLQQAGFDSARSFDFGIGTDALALAGTIAAWFVLPFAGRRRLYLVGLSIMLLILLTVDFMRIPARIKAIGWASGALMMVFVFTYDITVGPVCYCLVAEIPTTRLRIKTAVLARNKHRAWSLRGKGGFIWAVPCTIALIWTYFRMPETKGRAISELDTRVSARNFAKEEIAVFERGLEHRLDNEEPTAWLTGPGRAVLGVIVAL